MKRCLTLLLAAALLLPLAACRRPAAPGSPKRQLYLNSRAGACQAKSRMNLSISQSICKIAGQICRILYLPPGKAPGGGRKAIQQQEDIKMKKFNRTHHQPFSADNARENVFVVVGGAILPVRCWGRPVAL